MNRVSGAGASDSAGACAAACAAALARAAARISDLFFARSTKTSSARAGDAATRSWSATRPVEDGGAGVAEDGVW